MSRNKPGPLSMMERHKGGGKLRKKDLRGQSSSLPGRCWGRDNFPQSLCFPSVISLG